MKCTFQNACQRHAQKTALLLTWSERERKHAGANAAIEANGTLLSIHVTVLTTQLAGNFVKMIYCLMVRM